ncbi:MAG: DNA-3-methyladenine glycosylase [Thermoleophilaceae bacterium]|nr:DNA-3-methyladenine glycosylase [Thermoleophilaceae bacterium]
MTTLERDFTPIGHYRMPGAGRDGVMRRRGRAIVRAIHHGDDCAVVAAWECGGGVRIRAQAPSQAAAAFAVERMSYGLNLGHDLRPFHSAFKRDPLIGPAIRRFPWIRPSRIADPFQALAWAISEQLIEVERAFAIQRRLAFRYGRRSTCGSLVDSPSAVALSRCAPAELQGCDLSAGRSLAMVMCAREVASGRVDLFSASHEAGWARLLRIREIGPWTIEKLAIHGQGRDDMLPAGDLAYIKLVGRLLDLRRRATVDEVRDLFAPYGEYAGLAGIYALAGARLRALPPPAPARSALQVTRYRPRSAPAASATASRNR